jgi:CheY-like chemotaxis protein
MRDKGGSRMKPPGMMEGSPRAMVAHTVLVVDDEPEVRKVVRTALLRRGYEVLEAEDGVAAFELLQRLSGGVQSLITEIHLPRMDGITLGQKVGADYPKIEVLYIAGFVAEPLTDIPSHRFLPKPFRSDALVQCIQSLGA